MTEKWISEAREKLAGWAARTVWRKGYNQPYWAYVVWGRAILAVAELLAAMQAGQVDGNLLDQAEDVYHELNARMEEVQRSALYKRSGTMRELVEMCEWALGALDMAGQLAADGTADAKEKSVKKGKRN